MRDALWYFDFISPYAYFALRRLPTLPAATTVHYRPILFAGLLKHFGQKGPAEIAAKRKWTYRACIWEGRRLKVPFRMPTAHPFNSLPYLRMSIAAGNTSVAIATLFDALWTTGADPADPTLIARLGAQLNVPMERLAEAQVKDQLRSNTEEAIQRGVFGVPSLRIDDEVFWGSDALEFAAAYLNDAGTLDAEMRRADTLPIGAARMPPS